MNRQLRVAFVLLMSLALIATTVFAQSPPSLVPNDQWYNPLVGQQMRFEEALFLIDQRERTSGANMQDVVAVVLDKVVDYTHSDLAPNCLINLFRDFTQPNPLILGPFSTHGTLTASNIGAIGNNGIGVATIALFPYSRVKIVSVGVVSADELVHLDAYEKGLRYALELKALGYNVRVVNCSIDVGLSISQELSNDLADAGIAVVHSAGQRAVNIDSSPEGQLAQDPMSPIVLVTGLERDNTLFSIGNFGSLSVSLGAPARTVTGLAPGEGVGNGSGTSVSAALGSQTILEELLYGPETDTRRAVLQVMATSSNKGLPNSNGQNQIRGDGGCIDMLAALGPSRVPPGPKLESVKIKGEKKLFLRGQNFGNNFNQVRVRVNGADKTSRIVDVTDGEVFLKKNLGLQSGTNIIMIRTPLGTATYTPVL